VDRLPSTCELPPSLQASKADDDQPRVGSVLGRFDAQRGAADAAVVGCGPAGLALAAELAARGVQVALIGACCARFIKDVSPRAGGLSYLHACIDNKFAQLKT